MVYTNETLTRFVRREFLWLWGIAVAISALSLTLMPLPPAGFARQLFIPVHTDSIATIFIALIVQNSVQLGIFVGVGLAVAHQIGLGAPLLEAWLRKEPIRRLLRDRVIPIAVIVVVVVGASAVRNSSFFRPSRGRESAAENEFFDSPASSKASEEIEKLGLVGTKPLTKTSLGVSYLAGAIEGELKGRLFEVSVIGLLLLLISGNAKAATDRRFLWAAVMIVALIRTIEVLLVERQNTVLVMSIFQSFGLEHEIGPIWPVVAQTGLRVIPSALGFGFLYVYYGIESSIVANFCVAVASYLFMMFRFFLFK